MLPDQYEKISWCSASRKADRCLFSSSLQGALHVGTVQFTPPGGAPRLGVITLQVQTCISTNLPCTTSGTRRMLSHIYVFALLQAPSSAPSATELDLLLEYTNVVPDTVGVQSAQSQ